MAIRVKRPFCVGLDVHSNNVWAACITQSTDRSESEHEVKQFETYYSDLTDLCSWIKKLHQKALKTVKWSAKFGNKDEIHVFMESTGKYSIPVYNVLQENGLIPHIVNPKNCRCISGQKQDQKDCDWIAELGSCGLLMDSFIPVRVIRDARDISRRRTKLVQNRADEYRRILNALMTSNFRIDQVFSDISGKSAMKVMHYLLETEHPCIEDLDRLIDGRCSILKYKDDQEFVEKRNRLRKSYSGAAFSNGSKAIMESALDHTTNLDQYIDSLEKTLADILKDYTPQLELLQTIPGVAELSAMQILVEIGGTVDGFKSVDQFINWCGLCPSSNQSNGKHKSVKIGKGGQYLKPVLIQCALTAVKSDEYLKAKYHRIAGRRGKKRALIAIARKMMIGAYYMLKNNIKWQPSDHEEVVEEARFMNEYREVQKNSRKLSKAMKNGRKVKPKDAGLAVSVLQKIGVKPADLIELMKNSNVSGKTLEALTGEAPANW